MTTSGCFAETCVGAASTPAATDNCALINQTCQSGACADTSCTTTGTECQKTTANSGVCDTTTGLCTGCTRTATSSDCSGTGMYCNTSTVSAGSYCTADACSVDAASATTAAPVCSVWESCDAGLTGVCVSVSCMASADCATMVCTGATTTTAGVCAQCDGADNSGAQCPANPTEDTWYECGTDGICVLNEDTGISGGGIAGIIIGSVVFLGAVVGLTLYCCKKDSKSHDAMQEALK